MSEKIISLDKFRKKKGKSREEESVPGTLVWLYCPKCDSLEYTEVIAPQGRYHNVCRSMVQEAKVKIDLRAEITVAKYNIGKIDELLTKADFFRKRLLAVRNSEETYLKRLYITAGFKVAPYTEDIDKIKDRLGVKEENELGMLISEFRYRPEKRFSME